MSFAEIEYSTQPEPPAGLEGVTWNWRDLVVGIIAAIGVFVVLGVALVGTAMAIYGEDSTETDLAQAMSTLVFDIFLVCMVLWVLRRKGAGLRQLGLRAPKRGIIAKDWGPWPGLLVLVVVAYFGAIACVSFYTLAADFVGLDELLPSQQLPDSFFDHAGVIAITGLAVIFGAPLAEEIFFRGFLFGGLRRYLSLPLAALATGVLFALTHGDPGLVIPFTMVGAILAFTYERSGTLLAPIAVHFTFNAVSFLLLLLIPSLR